MTLNYEITHKPSHCECKARGNQELTVLCNYET